MNPPFFNDVKDPKLRHLLQKLLYETQEDLNNLQRELEKAGVDVIRISSWHYAKWWICRELA